MKVCFRFIPTHFFAHLLPQGLLLLSSAWGAATLTAPEMPAVRAFAIQICEVPLIPSEKPASIHGSAESEYLHLVDETIDLGFVAKEDLQRLLQSNQARSPFGEGVSLNPESAGFENAFTALVPLLKDWSAVREGLRKRLENRVDYELKTQAINQEEKPLMGFLELQQYLGQVALFDRSIVSHEKLSFVFEHKGKKYVLFANGNFHYLMSASTGNATMQEDFSRGPIDVHVSFHTGWPKIGSWYSRFELPSFEFVKDPDHSDGDPLQEPLGKTSWLQARWNELIRGIAKFNHSPDVDHSAIVSNREGLIFTDPQGALQIITNTGFWADSDPSWSFRRAHQTSLWSYDGSTWPRPSIKILKDRETRSAFPKPWVSGNQQYALYVDKEGLVTPYQAKTLQPSTPVARSQLAGQNLTAMDLYQSQSQTLILLGGTPPSHRHEHTFEVIDLNTGSGFPLYAKTHSQEAQEAPKGELFYSQGQPYYWLIDPYFPNQQLEIIDARRAVRMTLFGFESRILSVDPISIKGSTYLLVWTEKSLALVSALGQAQLAELPLRTILRPAIYQDGDDVQIFTVDDSKQLRLFHVFGDLEKARATWRMGP
jgi:hypothetical protein